MILFLAIITIIILAIIFFIFKKTELHVCPNSKYPEMEFMYVNRKIIQKEFFNNINKNSNWSNWMEYDRTTNTPIFSLLDRQKIINRLKENACSLDDGKPSWKLFGLILYGQPIEENIKYCPNTINLLNQFSNIIVNAGFSCLEPGVTTQLHKDFNNTIWRCHIPIYIPNGNTALNVNGDILKWDDKNFFIFDDTYDHQAWNYTKEKRIVLIIDILKR